MAPFGNFTAQLEQGTGLQREHYTGNRLAKVTTQEDWDSINDVNKFRTIRQAMDRATVDEQSMAQFNNEFFEWLDQVVQRGSPGMLAARERIQHLWSLMVLKFCPQVGPNDHWQKDVLLAHSSRMLHHMVCLFRLIFFPLN